MSELRCWPGCLARLNYSEIPENEGAIVEVIAINPYWSEMAGATMWDVDATRELVRVDDGSRGREGVARDTSLTPITPPPDALDIDTRIERDEALTA